MAATLAHRGPDAEGYHVDGPLGLGHQRLSVIDLSDAAHEPMSNEDGSLWLVFNGEIYNFRELRRELEPRHSFRSRSDGRQEGEQGSAERDGETGHVDSRTDGDGMISHSAVARVRARRKSSRAAGDKQRVIVSRRSARTAPRNAFRRRG